MMEEKEEWESLGLLPRLVLEERGMRGLSELLKNDHGITVHGTLKRHFFQIKKEKYLEVGIFGIGEKDGKEFVIVGEGQPKPTIGSINKLIKKGEKVKKITGKGVLLVVVCFSMHPRIQSYAEEKGVYVYFSYQLPLIPFF